MMISHATAYWLGKFSVMYFSAILDARKAYEYLRKPIDSEDFGIAIAIIPRMLSSTETRMNIRIYNPVTNYLDNYQRLDTIHPNEVGEYLDEIRTFWKDVNLASRATICYMPELSDTTP